MTGPSPDFYCITLSHVSILRLVGVVVQHVIVQRKATGDLRSCPRAGPQSAHQQHSQNAKLRQRFIKHLPCAYIQSYVPGSTGHLLAMVILRAGQGRAGQGRAGQGAGQDQ